MTRTSGCDELGRHSDPESWEEFWIPELAEADQVLLSEELPQTMLDQWNRVQEVFQAADEPVRELTTLVAYRLNRAPLPETDEDFVAFVVDPDFGDPLIDHLERVARPEVFASLRKQGLIGEREGTGE